MLSAEPNVTYRVWPSWANAFSFHWSDMVSFMENPVASGRLNWNAMQSLREGVLVNETDIQAYYPNPCGNGVFSFRRQQRAWIGEKMFWAEAECCGVAGMEMIRFDEVAKVAYYHLRGDSGLRFLGEGRKKPAEYRCYGSLEHVDASAGRIYWLADVAPSTRNAVHGMESIPEVARGFGMDAAPVAVADIEPAILEEIQPWFPNRADMAWFEVSGGESKAGVQFAMMYYAALHLRSVAGKRIRSMHLISQIEGRPNVRYQWK